MDQDIQSIVPSLRDPAIGARKAYVIVEVTERHMAEQMYGLRRFITSADVVATLGSDDLRSLGLWDQATKWDQERGE